MPLTSLAVKHLPPHQLFSHYADPVIPLPTAQPQSREISHSLSSRWTRALSLTANSGLMVRASIGM